MNYHIKRVLCDDMIAIGQALTQQHYAEVPFGKGQHQLNIDWDSMRILEDKGCLLGLAAFDESNLVGYIVIIVTPMLHHAGKYMAITDSFFVHPEYRGKGIFDALLCKAAEECEQVGIVALRVSVNQNFPLEPEMLNKLGYALAETIYQQEF